MNRVLTLEEKKPSVLCEEEIVNQEGGVQRLIYNPPDSRRPLNAQVVHPTRR